MGIGNYLEAVDEVTSHCDRVLNKVRRAQSSRQIRCYFPEKTVTEVPSAKFQDKPGVGFVDVEETQNVTELSSAERIN